MESKDWIDLARKSDRWPAVVNVEMNVPVPQNGENASLAENLIASQEGPYSTELVS
jgi:hypothetical protein